MAGAARRPSPELQHPGHRPGIRPERSALSFYEVYQGDPSRGERGHFGLGLYIAQAIVKRHGGSIEATNAKEGGALVRFSIRC